MSVPSTSPNPTPAASHKILSDIQLLSIDVDGVLTDGGIYYGDDGNSFRKFNAKDGMGLTLLRKAGVEVAIISAGAPGAIEHRAKRLGIEYVFTNIENKLSVFHDLTGKLGINMAHTAHMGDDVNDLHLMRAAGVAIATADAVGALVAAASIVTSRRGGDGAVREVCDAIIDARNLHQL